MTPVGFGAAMLTVACVLLAFMVIALIGPLAIVFFDYLDERCRRTKNAIITQWRRRRRAYER
jgi:hypothetical protein